MAVTVPERLAANCRGSAERAAWLEELPGTLQALAQRWSLTLGPPFDGDEVSAAWVAPVTRADGSPAVLKLIMPHMEAEHEIDGLRFWSGDPTVHLLDADDALKAMVIERCDPGTVLRSLPEIEQDVVIAGLLVRIWRVPPVPHPFRPLSAMIALWIEEAMMQEEQWPDGGLVREGLRLFEELARTTDSEGTLLATDLHAGNVLRAQREPWLVIDPKPFVGDMAYDATQHLVNCEERLREDPLGTVARFAGLLELDPDRIRMWMFARLVAESRDDWNDGSMDLGRALAP